MKNFYEEKVLTRSDTILSGLGKIDSILLHLFSFFFFEIFTHFLQEIWEEIDMSENHMVKGPSQSI